MHRSETINFNSPITINLANAYVPNQVFQENYSPQQGLAKGTMFPELYKPY